MPQKIKIIIQNGFVFHPPPAATPVQPGLGYDDLHMSGVSRDEARARTRPAIDRLLTAWAKQG